MEKLVQADEKDVMRMTPLSIGMTKALANKILRRHGMQKKHFGRMRLTR